MRERRVRLPQELLPLSREGARRCAPDAFVFAGNRAGEHLTTRMAERIVRRTARGVGLASGVSSLTLRHTYAVDCLEAGATVREVQAALGHAHVETTLRYERCRLPPEARIDGIAGSPPTVCSPLDVLPGPLPPGPGLVGGGAPAMIVPPVSTPAGRDAAGSPAQPGSSSAPVAAETADVLALLPTAFIETWFAGVDFCRALKTHVRDRFLALRRAVARGG
jgi:hypothetical protein